MGAETASHSLRVEANSAAERSRVVLTLGVVTCFPSSPPLRAPRGVAPMDIDKKADVADEDSWLASGNSCTCSICDAPQPILHLKYGTCCGLCVCACFPGSSSLLKTSAGWVAISVRTKPHHDHVCQERRPMRNVFRLPEKPQYCTDSGAPCLKGLGCWWGPATNLIRRASPSCDTR